MSENWDDLFTLTLTVKRCQLVYRDDWTLFALRDGSGGQIHIGDDYTPVAGLEPGVVDPKGALDLMRSLSINPLIPDSLRIMMKESLDRTRRT